MGVYIARSRPSRDFKSLLGNANHLVITALVGLEAIERGVVREVPEDLRAAWSPKDPISSAKRSRRLILDMALIRAIDAVDVYLRAAVRKPALIQSADFRRELDAAGLSIFRKLQVVERHCVNLDVLPLAIIFVMVAWRNRGAHSEADLDVPDHHIGVLRSNPQAIKDRFRGLDVDTLLGGYEAVRSTNFKEVASLINAAHHLVSELEARLLSCLDVERYTRDVIWTSLSDSKNSKESIEQCRKRRATSIWGRDPIDRGDAILKLLRQSGFSSESNGATPEIMIPIELLESLSNHTPSSIIAWASADG